MDLKDIKAIIDLMKKNSITEFELEQQDSKLRLKRGLNGGSPVAQDDDASLPIDPAAHVSAASAAPAHRPGQPIRAKLTSNRP